MLRADDLPPQVRARLGLGVLEKKRTKRTDDAERSFLAQCKLLSLPPVFAQWRYEKSQFPGNPRRKWAADFVFKDFKLICEIDGGIWIKGAHAHPLDITRNMTKGNDAALLGFMVLHFTPTEVKSGHAVAFTEKVLKTRGWKQ